VTGRLHDTVIVGVDPGLTCGFATLLHGTEFESVDLSYDVALDRLYGLVTTAERRAVISVERFTPNGRAAMTRQTHALRFIGAAQFIARRFHALSFNVIGASDAQGVAPPQVLRRLGWWQPGRDHLNRAASQVGYALATVLPDEFERLTAE